MGGGLLVLLLLYIGIKGCQASQKEQGFKDYVRDASELVAESEQQSTALFDLLGDPGNSEVDFTSNVNGSKVQAEQLVDRAKKTDVPDELKGAHENLVETLEFRRDGLDGIAREVAAAGGEDGGEASERIAAQMQYFLTSDVIYSQRFLPKLLRGIEEEDLDQDVPVPDTLRDPQTIAFLPEIGWLRPATVSERLAGVGAGAGGDEPAAPGLHGTGLGSVAVKPAGTALVEGQAAQLPASEDVSFDIEVANQGENPEESIVVAVEIAGASGEPISLEETLDTINPGESKIVNVPLAETPPIGEPVDITVRIEPVPGEEKTDNNEGSFTAVFAR